MTAELLPPIRSASTLRCPNGTLSYDTWGTAGRPTLFIHSVRFDRRVWWPVAAELHRQCVVIAVDLPGHGMSPARDQYEPELVVDDIGALLGRHPSRHAPIVVGHGASAGLANLFAQRFPTHALVLVDPPVEAALQPVPTTGAGTPDPLAEVIPADVPPYFRHLVRPSPPSGLLEAYSKCVDVSPWCGVAFDSPLADVNRRTIRLAIYSQAPPPDPRHVLRRTLGGWRYSVYDNASPFPQLSDLRRFSAEIRSLV